jgi:hypothetical protein
MTFFSAAYAGIDFSCLRKFPVPEDTLALQFLREGARAGEKGLYITLSETEAELSEVAFPMDGPSTAEWIFLSSRRPKTCSTKRSTKSFILF